MRSVPCSPKRYLLIYLLFSVLFIAATAGLILFETALQERSDRHRAVRTDAAASPVVVIDAGHGGEDGGAVGSNGIYEKDINLRISVMLCDLLRANGVETVMTRTEDVLLYDKTSDHHGQKKAQDLANRRKIAEQYEHAVFVSIHMNAFPQAKYRGLQVYYSPNHSKSQHLAQTVQSLVQQTLQPENSRKIKPSGGTIYLLEHLTCPAVLVECGFLSNPEECALLSTEDYQRKLALLLCLSVLSYFSEQEANLCNRS